VRHSRLSRQGGLGPPSGALRGSRGTRDRQGQALGLPRGGGQHGPRPALRRIDTHFVHVGTHQTLIAPPPDKWLWPFCSAPHPPLARTAVCDLCAGAPRPQVLVAAAAAGPAAVGADTGGGVRIIPAASPPPLLLTGRRAAPLGSIQPLRCAALIVPVSWRIWFPDKRTS
jgi:hypothetical protein